MTKENSKNNNNDQKKRLALTNFGCGCASMAVIIILVVFIILLGEKIAANKDSTISRTKAVECGQSMLTVNVAINSYRADNEGKYPSELTDLEKYLFNPEDIYCPMMRGKGTKKEYAYTPQNDIILTCKEHKRGSIRLKNNGKVLLENLTIKNLRRWHNDAKK